MVDHLVLFKRKAETTPEQEKELVRRLQAMKGKIPGIIDISAGLNFSERSKGYTVGLVVRFTDRAALEAYGPHAVHQEVVAYVRQITDDVLALDYEF